jgi:subtilisin-like proprotein convertase family protein
LQPGGWKAQALGIDEENNMIKNTKSKFHLKGKIAPRLSGSLIFAIILGAITISVNAQTTFTNSASITLNDSPAAGSPGLSDPYPSTINVTGLSGTISDVNVRINGLTHTFPGDLGLLLVGPGGQNLILHSFVGGDPDLNNLTYTVDDQAATAFPNNGPILAQSYRPTSRLTVDGEPFFPASGANPPPAACQNPQIPPAATCGFAAPAGMATLASIFNGANPNGAWRLYAGDYGPVDEGLISGGWSLIITTSGPALPTVQFSAATFTTGENAAAMLTVTRAGDTSGASTVNYASTDTFTFAECNAAGTTANQRCDYTLARGTLSFAAGETSKTITVPIIDDVYTESGETFTVGLSSPTGASVGTQGTTTVTITDNDTAAGANRTFVGRLDNAQEVPTNNSTATGSGTVLLNDAENQITVNMSFTGLSSAQTAAHIHAAAHVGVNAPVLFNLGTGTITNATFPVTPAQVAQLRAGLMYFNVHTANFPGGEIRGQIVSQPSENARFFVQQQYYDFLSRTPDQAGFDFWTGQIVNTCGTDLACIRRRRVDVSNAFFFELEYQRTGSYVYRLYRAAYGNNHPASLRNTDVATSCPAPQPAPTFLGAHLPKYEVFAGDRALINPSQLAASQLALATNFAARPEFVALYPTSQTAEMYVDALLGNIQAATGANLTSQRAALITLFGTGGRGAVLYRLADDDMAGNPINNRAFIDAEYNRAFVSTQYYGYLRRDGDVCGLNFWLRTVNNFPLRSATGQNAMVCAFITSAEYQQRFSAGVTRTNAECPTVP